MKLRISKTALFTVLATLGAGTIPVNTLKAESAVSQEQMNKLHAIHRNIKGITDITIYLIGTLDSANAPYKLDELVVRLESTEALIIKLKAQIAAALAVASKSDSSYINALEKKADVVGEVHEILKKLAETLRSGLMNSIPAGKVAPAAIKFCKLVEAPLKQLSSPEEIGKIEAKLTHLLSATAEISEENADMIKELLKLVGKLKSTTNTKSQMELYNMVNRRIPKGRPFEGISQGLSLAGWIHETNNSSLIECVEAITQQAC